MLYITVEKGYLLDNLMVHVKAPMFTFQTVDDTKHHSMARHKMFTDKTLLILFERL